MTNFRFFIEARLIKRWLGVISIMNNPKETKYTYDFLESDMPPILI